MNNSLTVLLPGYLPRHLPCAIEGRAVAPWITLLEPFHHERERDYTVNVTDVSN